MPRNKTLLSRLDRGICLDCGEESHDKRSKQYCTECLELRRVSGKARYYEKKPIPVIKLPAHLKIALKQAAKDITNNYLRKTAPALHKKFLKEQNK